MPRRVLPRFTMLCCTVICLFWAPATSFAQKPKAKPAPPKIRLPESVRQKTKIDMKVTSVSAGGREDAARAANRMDGHVEDQLISKGMTPNPLASDEVFLRRVYLDVAGRIPTLQEATDFLNSTDASRRENLIDGLLNSPDYVSNMYNFWADTLRLVERPQNNIIADPYLAYVKDAIRTNKKYNQWVYEMLTADGKLWENPATGFQIRDEGMPLPYIDNTVRVFLGTQIGCAQCHDHPFDQWTQYQFYELAAYTAGVRTRITKGDPGFTKSNPAGALIAEARKFYPNGRVPGAFQRITQANTYSVKETKATMRLPHDYAYSDAKPNDVVQPAVLWGEVPSSASKSSLREQFAAWLTSPENPQFSHSIVNRLWKRFMGIGLVEPMDDFRDEHPCSNEPLMEFMASEMIRVDFDLKQFLRTILYSQTYQREASDFDLTSGETYYFPGPTVRRMTAEQVWDSLLTLAVHNPMPFQRPDAKDIAPLVDIDFSKANFDSVKALSERFEKSYFDAAYKKSLNQHAFQGNVLCRASELPSPQPGEHFLRQFGQGDRETINGADQDATVPQILAMFNGPITHVMLEPGSAIVDNVTALPSARDRVDAIFLSVLTRSPNAIDRRAAASELTRADRIGSAYGNIIWALLNTREFLFVQ